jgi:predicted P-loop ATPase
MKGKSVYACNFANAMLALEKDPVLANAFGYDEMLRTKILLRPILNKRSDPDFVLRPVTDSDVLGVQGYLQWEGFKRLGKITVHDAIERYARLHPFHPVREWLEALRWDGTKRIYTWTHKYLGSPDSEYTRGVGKMLLIGMVARIFQPGCKLDYMAILEGAQGILKSAACKALAGEYFSDGLPDISSKDAALHLRGKWLVEVAELRAYGRAALDHFKEFLTRTEEIYRPPYGREEIREPRQCVFIGTTNKDLYLRDETGNRRYWPLPTGTIEIDKLKADRGQLFAEAVALYRSGEHWWPTAAFERDHAIPEQEARIEVDIWEPAIAAFLQNKSKTTLWDVATGALGFSAEDGVARVGTVDQRRITACLVHLQWEPRRGPDKKGSRFWAPKIAQKQML